jgi:hypothetical protein
VLFAILKKRVILRGAKNPRILFEAKRSPD